MFPKTIPISPRYRRDQQSLQKQHGKCPAGSKALVAQLGKVLPGRAHRSTQPPTDGGGAVCKGIMVGGRTRREPLATAVERTRTDSVLAWSCSACTCLPQAWWGNAVWRSFSCCFSIFRCFTRMPPSPKPCFLLQNL